ncbi:translation initiation inhibitor [Opitutaceae bacterium TAV5]|nr:translation initiation inhibitor [Opitutaceae bacterium TAV5]
MSSTLLSPTPAAIKTLARAENGIHIAPLTGGLVAFSANARTGETVGALLVRLQEAADRYGLVPVQANAFCHPKTGASLHTGFPVTYLGRHDTPAGDVRSARLCALPARSFTRLQTDIGGAPCGVTWETGSARYLLLGALVPPDISAPRDVQSAALWETLKTRLETNGFSLRNLVRTWFFNDHILDWYADFNRVRNAFFTANNVFGTLVPASTGIGASNSAGAALTLDALAVAPFPSAATTPTPTPLETRAVASPLQCAAYDYKSAFSRAVEITTPDGRHLLVSGTASIEPGGRTAHPGDLDSQIDLSLRVVAAILESRDMAWTDVARAILYFPDISWMPRFETRRTALGLPPLPAIHAHCDICRDDLLFEIELDAWKAKDGTTETRKA